MNPPRESIFFSSLRAFFVTCFAIMGMLAAILILVALSELVEEHEVSRTYSVKVLPNAENKREVLGSKVPVILQLNIHGVIGTDDLTMTKVRNRLVESREGDLKDDRVKALLLSINSPGGTVTDSDGIYQVVKAYKERYKVPVIAYVNGMAASGGLYVAAAADKIVADEASLIGSVGVILPPFFNVTDLMEKIGVQSETIFSGKGKDLFNPFRKWEKEEGESIRTVVDYYYQSFVDILTRNRPQLSREKLVADYGARIFPAEEAQTLGFIDASGYTMSDAIKLTLAEADLEGRDYRVVQLEGKEWLQDLLKAQSPLVTGTVKHQLVLGAEFDPHLMGKFLYLYCPHAHP